VSAERIAAWIAMPHATAFSKLMLAGCEFDNIRKASGLTDADSLVQSFLKHTWVWRRRRAQGGFDDKLKMKGMKTTQLRTTWLKTQLNNSTTLATLSGACRVGNRPGFHS
jgi:hypothetical protein